MCRSKAETNTRISCRIVIPTERSERRNLQFQFASWSASGLRPPLTTAERNDKALAFCEPSLGKKRNGKPLMLIKTHSLPFPFLFFCVKKG